MKYIALTKSQADDVRGRHGRYSEIQPIEYNGSYLIPYEVLNDADLIEVRAKIESYNAEIIEPIFTYEDKAPIEINEEIVIDYDEEVNRLIRQKYTASQEFSILRQRDEKPEEFAEYNEYCEWCKSEIKRIYNL